MKNTTDKEENAPVSEMGVINFPIVGEQSSSQAIPMETTVPEGVKTQTVTSSAGISAELSGYSAKEASLVQSKSTEDVPVSSASQALNTASQPIPISSQPIPTISQPIPSSSFIIDEMISKSSKGSLPMFESTKKTSISLAENIESKAILVPEDTSRSSKGINVSSLYSRSSVTLSASNPLATMAEARIRPPLSLETYIPPASSYVSSPLRAQGLSYPRQVYCQPSTNTGMQSFYGTGHHGRPAMVPSAAGTMLPVFGDPQFQPRMTRSPLIPTGMHAYAWNSSVPPRSPAPMRYNVPISSPSMHMSYRSRNPHPVQQLRISRWVNPIPPDPDDGPQQTGEQELATKLLQIQSKRFYIDVKQNRRGRFMKVAEIGADGRRNQIFLALSTAEEFKENLSVFSVYYANLGPPNPDALPEDGKLKSETMVKDNRRYYLDLKENARGRFLRVSQTIARGGPRCQIAIPAQGLIEFRDALQELLEEFGTDDGGYKGELPEGRHMRVENKNFYFDIGQNNRGIYMRISEVKTNFRTAITIPEKSWSRFRDIFADYVDKMKEGEKNTSENNK